ncbi:hypothetical protein MACH05_21100 [Qipengyuania nanhaisediminis]
MLALALSGCVTYPDISQSRSPCRMEPGGWCGFVRAGAAEAWPYAVAATNAYQGDDDIFADLGPRLERLERAPIDPEHEGKGFSYEVFALYPPESEGDAERTPEKLVMAYRGTDVTGLSDVFYGTLRSDQTGFALDYFEAELARRGRPLEDWVVTGHSLGGALATEVSIRYPQVRAYMFNTSPFYRGDAMANDARRTVFNERGEWLRRFARYSRAPASDLYTLNCGPQRGAFTKHRIRLIADCIAWIAAYEDPEAYALVQSNAVPKPPVECGPDDKTHPGAQFRQLAPCVHRARPEEAGQDG